MSVTSNVHGKAVVHDLVGGPWRPIVADLNNWNHRLRQELHSGLNLQATFKQSGSDR